MDPENIYFMLEEETGTKNEEDILTKPASSKIDLLLAGPPGYIFSSDCSMEFSPCQFSATCKPPVRGVKVEKLKERFLDQLQDLFNLCEHETSKFKTYNLMDLDRATKYNISYEAGYLMHILFKLGKTSTIAFSAQDKEIIAPLLVKVIDSITLSIENCVSRPNRSRLEASVLQKRSAIQFLKDNFGDFPVENTVLLNKLQQHIEYCINILDDTIEKYQNKYDADEGEDDFPREGLYDMPSTHVWWWNKWHCNQNCRFLNADGFIDLDY